MLPWFSKGLTLDVPYAEGVGVHEDSIALSKQKAGHCGEAAAAYS